MLQFKNSEKSRNNFCKLDGFGFYNIFYETEEIGCIQLSELTPETHEFLLSELKHLGIEKDELNFFKSLLTTLSYRNCLFLDILSIDEDLREKGYGKNVVNQLKKESSVPVLLFSIESAEGFWSKMGFKELFKHVYLYEQKEQIYFN